MRILITGADGQLGRDLLDCLAGRVPAGGRRCALLGPEGPRPGLEHEVLGTDIDTMPVDDRDAVLATCAAFRPDLVLHGGALTAVERCETEPDLAYAVNAIGTRHVAEACGLEEADARQLVDYLAAGLGELGVLPTADDIVFTCGPWSKNLFDSLRRLQVYRLADRAISSRIPNRKTNPLLARRVERHMKFVAAERRHFC